MPRPPLPKLTAPPQELRARSLRILLEIVRAKYPQHWLELVEAVRAAGGKTEALLDAIERWLRARRLLDEPERIAIASVVTLLADEPVLQRESWGMIEMWAALFAAAPTLSCRLPAPVTLRAEYKLGADENDDIRAAFFWSRGVNFGEIREKILADFTEKLDAALAQYRANCGAAGLAQQAVSPAERERMEWLASHLVERRSAAWLAEHLPEARRDEYRNADAVRKALAAAAASCGLRLRRGRG